jgi:hypothetical protein
MRKIATVRNNHPTVKRVMICEEDNSGSYLFTYSSNQDGPCNADYWYDTLEEAAKACAMEFGITDGDWIRIEDCLEGCQQDWIVPVRVKGRESGSPQWGHYEQLKNGVWKKVATT